MALGVRMGGVVDAGAAIAMQADALDRPLAHPAELWVAEVEGEAWSVGAFQRGHGMPEDAPLVRRISGGAPARLGPGSVHVVLALASPSVWFAIPASKIMNRYLRPLLRALTRSGAHAAYFGRDWISVTHHPAAAVGFAHDAGTGRATLEAIVAMRSPFSLPRASFLGKEPSTLEVLTGKPISSTRLVEAIRDAYVDAAGGASVLLDPLPPPPASSDAKLRGEPAWAAEVSDVIGVVAAGPDATGVVRVGGDMMASRDAIVRLERSVASMGGRASDEALEEAVRDAFGVEGAVLEGVRDPTALCRVLRGALDAGADRPKG